MRIIVAVAALALAVLGGCVAEPYRTARIVTTPGGLSSDEIVRMARSGVSDQVIIEKIQSEGVSARPAAEQVESLKKEGLSDAVVGAMMAARVEAPKETRVEYVYDYPYGYYSPYYYSYPYPYYYGYYRPYYYPYGSYWYGRPYWGGHYYHSYPRGGYSVSHYRR